jgi:UDP-N-acetylmuramoyl-tripeptide--D-alanyl-D-alanine ligase
LAKEIQGLKPASMRGELLRLANGALVVNDLYNSNPEALEAMLQTVAALPARRHLAVLGGMMELGQRSTELHEQCGRRVVELRFAGLATVGEEARPLAEGARAAGMPEAALLHFATAEEAGEHLCTWLRDGDVALLKASRAVHLENVWNALGPAAPVSSETGEMRRAAKTATEG